ncbi:MAG: hypothetical protein LZF62_480159 [Nitrospira sp.]|nr:MAG: hypothetical protein LZF62_480159 [Nitrospira sp.]
MSRLFRGLRLVGNHGHFPCCGVERRLLLAVICRCTAGQPQTQGRHAYQCDDCCMSHLNLPVRKQWCTPPKVSRQVQTFLSESGGLAVGFGKSSGAHRGNRQTYRPVMWRRACVTAPSADCVVG